MDDPSTNTPPHYVYLAAPFERQIMGQQAGLIGQQAGDIPAARQQAGQQIANQFDLGRGGLANEQLLGLRGQDLQRQLAMSQLAQQGQQFGSQFGLQAQQQAYNQQIAPMLQLLMAALSAAGPTAFQTIVPGKK